MSDLSPRLALPYLAPAQAQKHVTVNEALDRLDLLVQAAVSDRTRTAPPASPVVGDRHIVAGPATGAWAGQEGRIALALPGGLWDFVVPKAGWRVEILAEGRGATYSGSAWISADALAQQFPELGVATAADATNRLAVAAPASLFTHAGSGGHQMKLNKAAAAETASLLYQTGFSGRAEIGLAGNDALSVKVSPDGSAWTTALSVTPATGAVSTPAGLHLPDGTGPAPGLAFAADPDTGLSRPAANQIALAAGGAVRLTVGGTALTAAVPLGLPAGTAPAPALSLNADPDTGLFHAAADVLGLAAGGTERARITTAGLQVTGLISGTAVSQSQTETTAGRLLKLADYGLGATTAPTATLNSSLRGGLYGYASGDAANPAAGAGGIVLIIPLSATLIYQIARAGAAAGAIWHRRTADGGTSWSAWVRQVDLGNLLGTVSQSGGTPTGSVIERGTNANGEFVRLADGTQICTRSLTLSAAAATSWTFPVAFSAAPVVSGTLVAGVLSALCQDTAPTTTAASLSARDAGNARRADPAHLLAVGRWF
jgi:hypothetical protein